MLWNLFHVIMAYRRSTMRFLAWSNYLFHSSFLIRFVFVEIVQIKYPKKTNIFNLMKSVCINIAFSIMSHFFRENNSFIRIYRNLIFTFRVNSKKKNYNYLSMDLKFLIGSNMELIEEILPVSILYKYHSFLGWGGS